MYLVCKMKLNFSTKKKKKEKKKCQNKWIVQVSLPSDKETLTMWLILLNCMSSDDTVNLIL